MPRTQDPQRQIPEFWGAVISIILMAILLLAAKWADFWDWLSGRDG